MRYVTMYAYIKSGCVRLPNMSKEEKAAVTERIEMSDRLTSYTEWIGAQTDYIKRTWKSLLPSPFVDGWDEHVLAIDDEEPEPTLVHVPPSEEYKAWVGGFKTTNPEPWLVQAREEVKTLHCDVSQLPPGWTAERHEDSHLKRPYWKYLGPNGENVRSKPEAWVCFQRQGINGTGPVQLMLSPEPSSPRLEATRSGSVHGSGAPESGVFALQQGAASA